MLDIEIKKMADQYVDEYDEIEYGSSDVDELRELVRRYVVAYIRGHRIGRFDDGAFTGGLEDVIEEKFKGGIDNG